MNPEDPQDPQNPQASDQPVDPTSDAADSSLPDNASDASPEAGGSGAIDQSELDALLAAATSAADDAAAQAEGVTNASEASPQASAESSDASPDESDDLTADNADDILAEMAAALAAEAGGGDAGGSGPTHAEAEVEPRGPEIVGGSINHLSPDAAAPIEAPTISSAVVDEVLSSLDFLSDVELNVKIELGRAQMYVEHVLDLGVGSVVELNKLAGDPVDIFVNERLVARGEVLVLNDNFCVRINDIVESVAEFDPSA